MAQAGNAPSVGVTPPSSPATGAAPAVGGTSPMVAFVQKALVAGMAEVELSRLALARSKDDQIRLFAERMVTDHGKAGDELAALAKRKGMTVPVTLDGEHRSTLDKLKQSADADFDRLYVENMTRDHDDAVNLFKTATAETTMDSDLREFAKKTLSTLEQHQRMARQLSMRPAG